MQSREITNIDYFNQSNQIVNIISNITTILRNTEMHTYNLVNSSRRNNIGLNRFPPFTINTFPTQSIFNLPNNTTETRDASDNTTNNPFVSEIFNTFTPVRIHPTARQISQATRMIQFNSIDNPRNNRCPIRHEDFEPTDMVMQIRHCQHNFNSNCLHRWFENAVRCPICRYDIRDYTPTQESENNPEPEPEPEPFSETVELNPTHNNVSSNVELSTSQQNLVESQQQDLSNNTISITAVFDRNIENIRNNIVNQLSNVIHDIVSNSQDASNNNGIISIEYTIENE